MTGTGTCDKCGFVWEVGKWQHHCPGIRRVACGYGRHGYFEATYGRCELCHLSSVIVIETDTSDGEYGPIYTCVPCIEMLVREFKESPRAKEVANEMAL